MKAPTIYTDKSGDALKIGDIVAEKAEQSAQNAEQATETTSAEGPATPTEKATETAATAPDMFAALATAYFAGKQAPKPAKAPKKAKETAPKENTEEAPKEPEKPPKTAAGYTGETAHELTPEQIEKLQNGEQTKIKKECWNILLTPAKYTDKTTLLYKESQYNAPAALIPGSDLKYYGFITTGKLYLNTAPIIKEMQADIETALQKAIPTEAAAEKNAGTLEKYDAEKITFAKERDYTDDGRRAFYEDKAPTLILYHTYNKPSAAEIIRYIESPAEIVTEYCNKYAESHRADILKAHINHNRTTKALKDIKENTSDKAHLLKAISDSISTQKTVKIEIENGPTVKAEAGAIKRIIYNNSISNYYIAAQDRDKLPKNEYNRAEDITAEQINAIYYNGRTLYHK